MPATSSGRGFTIPTVNADGNVWGNELNAMINQVDACFSNSLTLQSSAAMNVTLSSSQAQSARIVVQGALATDFILTFPSSNYALGGYTVWNNSSAGGGGVLCGTGGGGSNVKVPQGQQRQIYVDGINAMFADSQSVSGASPLGFVNKFRNASFDVAQRGINSGSSLTQGWNSSQGGNGSSVGGYSLDGWMLLPSAGPGLSWMQNGSGPINGNALRIFGPNAGSIALRQRIESMSAAQLSNKTGAPGPITAQFLVYNNSGSALTPQIATYYPGATDNWSIAPSNDLIPTNLQPIPPNTTAVVAYTFVPSALITRGYQVDLLFGNILNGVSSGTGWIDVGQADIRATPGLSAGQNNAPPMPELRPISFELDWCYRYLYVPSSGAGFCSITNPSSLYGVLAQGQIEYPVPMRLSSSGANPALMNWTHNSGSGFTSIAVSNQGSNNKTAIFNCTTPVGPGITCTQYLQTGFFTNEL